MKLHCKSSPQAVIVLQRLRELDPRTDALNEGEAIRLSRISTRALGSIMVEFPDVDTYDCTRGRLPIDATLTKEGVQCTSEVAR